MSLSTKEKEMVAVGVSVAAGCMPCTDYHVKAARECGLTDDEIRQAITDAMCVRESALNVMKAHGLQHLGDEANDTGCGCESTNKMKEMISVGAAHAVNCTTNLKQHLHAANAHGVTDTQLKEVVKLARFIKNKAASHVDKLTASANEEQTDERASAGCC